MLVGMDESHLFICPLERNASSVREAHRKLAPDGVHRARRRLKVRRQGEWFFVPARSRDERTLLGEAYDLGRIRQDVGLTAGGRPHFVQEHMEIDGDVFVRGRVRHPDHKVIVLKDWHRVRTTRVCGGPVAAPEGADPGSSNRSATRRYLTGSLGVARLYGLRVGSGLRPIPTLQDSSRAQSTGDRLIGDRLLSPPLRADPSTHAPGSRAGYGDRLVVVPRGR